MGDPAQCVSELDGMRCIYELAPNWVPGELSETAFELPGNYQHENCSTLTHLRRSVQNTHISPLKTNSYCPILDTGASPQSFTTDCSEIPNGTMEASPATSISTSITYSSNDEKEDIQGWNFSCNKSQTLSNPLSHSYSSPDSITMHGQNPAGLVHGLAQIVYMVNDGWMNVLANMLQQSDINNYFATPSPFTTGIKALQQYYCGSVLGTLREIFPLLLIAFAAACLIHHGEILYPWDRFFEEVAQWSEHIVDPREKKFFQRAVHAFHSNYNVTKGNYSQMNCVCSSWVASSQVSAREMTP